MGRSSVLPALAVTVLATWLAGCSTYDRRYAYTPAPAAIETTLPASGHTVRTLATVIGIRHGDGSPQQPPAVEVRLRVENRSPDTWVTLEPTSLSLVSASLDQFDAPTVVPREATVVGPDASSTVTAFFPFPPGPYPDTFDLAGLNLRWALQADGHSSTHSASFQRRPYYRHYGYPHYTFGVHYGHGHHWHGGSHHYFYWCD